ncbi:hypothetical protein PSEUDO9AZ_20398 [Pseudomonas sp. 9AZ]|nr:hypothetical protein PSEUDO9AZ_20398 [Pseudomonas sp. 9AZ]
MLPCYPRSYPQLLWINPSACSRPPVSAFLQDFTWLKKGVELRAFPATAAFYASRNHSTTYRFNLGSSPAHPCCALATGQSSPRSCP